MLWFDCSAVGEYLAVFKHAQKCKDSGRALFQLRTTTEFSQDPGGFCLQEGPLLHIYVPSCSDTW